MARKEFSNLWDALNADDVAGKLTADIGRAEGAGNSEFRTAVDKIKNNVAVADLTGAKITHARGRPQVDSAQRVGRGIVALDIIAFGVSSFQYGPDQAMLDLEPSGVLGGVVA